MIKMAQNTANTKGFINYYNSNNILKTLRFLYNPTTIQERRVVEYNFSKAQGQVLPQAQFSMIGETEIKFKLLLHHANVGVDEVSKHVNSLRALVLPRGRSRLPHYNSIQPSTILLALLDVVHHGVIKELNFNHIQFSKDGIKPMHVEVDVVFIATSNGLSHDLVHIKQLTHEAE